jgi:hypothetical protein
VASYFVQWAAGRVVDHGALFSLVIGRWGEGAEAAERVLVALEYRLIETGPAFSVVDGAGRPGDTPRLVGRALTRAEVVGTPMAREAFAIADAVLGQDGRLGEILGRYRVTPRRRPWWRFWR